MIFVVVDVLFLEAVRVEAPEPFVMLVLHRMGVALVAQQAFIPGVRVAPQSQNILGVSSVALERRLYMRQVG